MPQFKNIWKQLRSSLHFLNSREEKRSKTSNLVAVSSLNQPQWTPRHYERFAEEGYRQNVIAYRCINEIARGLAMVPFVVRHKNKALKEDPYHDHPLLKLLQRPNPLQGGASFIESVISYLLISGNAYIEAVGPEHELPQELYCLRPDRMRVMPSKQGLPFGYTYDVDGKSVTFKADPLTGVSDILHLKTFNPLDDWYGLSPIEAAAFSIDQHNAAGAHNQALLQNGARPVGALMYKPGEGVLLTESQRESLKEQLDQNYKGALNAGKMLVLEGDFEWKEMGLRPRDMDFIEMKHSAARDIAQAFGVPPVLVGLPTDATYSNLAEARLALWEQTIIPLLDHLTDALNVWLVPRFQDENLELSYDLDQVPALALKRQSVWEKIRQADFLTLNEKRKAVGFFPLKNGDFLQNRTSQL
jgi:HK97 family phage portal protein